MVRTERKHNKGRKREKEKLWLRNKTTYAFEEYVKAFKAFLCNICLHWNALFLKAYRA